MSYRVEKIRVSRKILLESIRGELIDYFQWTSVQGLVELESDLIAQNVLARILNRSTEKPEEGMSGSGELTCAVHGLVMQTGGCVGIGGDEPSCRGADPLPDK